MTTLYLNGNVLTMDPARFRTDAFAVDGGRFVAVGPDAVELASRGEVIDLGGRTVVPGLIDAHTHLETSAIAAAKWVDVRELSLDGMLAKLGAFARTADLSHDEWIVGQGTFGQESALPRREILDRICPDRPLVLRASMHACSANTRALERAGLMHTRHSPVGAQVIRDDDGLPTGQVLEGFHLFPIKPAAVGELADMIESHIREHFSRYGVTTIYEVPMSSEGVQAFQLLEREGRLRSRISLNPAIKPGLQPLLDDIEHWAGLGLRSGFGSSMLWLGAAKYFLDGAGEAAMELRDPERPSTWGALTHLYEDLVRSAIIGYRSGIQLWIHAIGETAQRFAIDALLEAQRVNGGNAGLKMRIEHIGCEHPVSEVMRRDLRRGDIIPVPTAAFMHFLSPHSAFPYRTLIDEGFQPPGNSDTAGAQPFASNPWFGIERMVKRTNKLGEAFDPAESVDVRTGLRTYTEFAANAGHRAEQLGAIRVGAWADFAVLNQDPLSIDADLASIESMLTVVGGSVAWES